MKQKLHVMLIAIFVAFSLASCDDAQNNTGTYTNGIFVVNEGAFGSSNSEVSFIKSDNSIINNQYAAANSGLVLGDVLQSLFIHSGKAYLIVNNSNKVEVVDIDDLKNTATINGLHLPRYMVTYNGKGYISEYVDYFNNGNIIIVDLSNNSIVDSVQVGMLPEQMMVVGNSILVANCGDSTLHLVNTTTLAKTNIGDVDYPKFITKTSDGNIWVLYTGKPSWAPGGETDGGLLVLNSTATAIVKNITIGCTPTSNPSQLTTDGNNLYYEFQGNIYKIDKSATVAPSTPFLTAPAMTIYGLNYYAASNTLLVGDAKNFVSSGVVRRFNASTGVAIDTLNCGVAPNGFVFN